MSGWPAAPSPQPASLRRPRSFVIFLRGAGLPMLWQPGSAEGQKLQIDRASLVWSTAPRRVVPMAMTANREKRTAMNPTSDDKAR
jgi:hypothetical protein